MEDYKKKYDEKVEKMRDFIKKYDGTIFSKDGEMYKDLIEAFPELKESEDEKIRKELIQYLKDYPNLPNGNCCRDDFFSWLEKQSEKKSKFEVGQWIVKPNGIATQVTDVQPMRYVVTEQDGFTSYYDICKADNDCHLWTSQDATHGDVLYSLDSQTPFIYKDRKPYEQASTYCGINIYGKFYIESSLECVITTDKYVPTTKEQRDLLFQKMKEAGYEWDAENKLLKKIEQKPVESDDNEKIIRDIIRMLDKVICYYKNKDNNSEMAKYAVISAIERQKEWLKSLRPNHWRPTKIQMEVLKKAADVATSVYDGILLSLYNDLLKL